MLALYLPLLLYLVASGAEAYAQGEGKAAACVVKVWPPIERHLPSRRSAADLHLLVLESSAVCAVRGVHGSTCSISFAQECVDKSVQDAMAIEGFEQAAA